jgi:signal transduction histidine kinase
LSAELEQPIILPCLDELRMRQFLHNLLSNAIRHISHEGRVLISAKTLSEVNELEISKFDTGEGIAAEEMQFIFSRFYHQAGKSDVDHDRTGLG